MESLKQLKTKQKKKWGFLSMLLGTLGASLLGKLLSSGGVIQAGNEVFRVVHNF